MTSDKTAAVPQASTASSETKKGSKLSQAKTAKRPRPEDAGERGPIPGEGGRPKKIPTQEQLDQLTRLAQIGSTYWEMALMLGVDENTFRARLRDTPEVAAAVNRGTYDLRTSLRRKQIKIALDDSHGAQATMLIWAGKTILGQSERVSVKIETEEDAAQALKRLFPDFDPSLLLPVEQADEGDDAR